LFAARSKSPPPDRRQRRRRRRGRRGQDPRKQGPHYGYNAQTNVFEDLVKAGVIDPTKVTRTALQNAASIAGLMLTTEAMVSEIPEPRQAAPAGGGHGGGMEACTRTSRSANRANAQRASSPGTPVLFAAPAAKANATPFT